jgi:hypothetical protein
LAQLERARLLRSRREGRRIIYAIDHDGTGALLRFLTQDCCTADLPAAPSSNQPQRRTHNLVTP